MLKVGQQRSNRKKTALAAEPCCASDSKSLMEFQGHTTTPQGWPELNANPNAMNTCDLCTVRAQSTSTVSPNMGLVVIGWSDRRTREAELSFYLLISRS